MQIQEYLLRNGEDIIRNIDVEHLSPALGSQLQEYRRIGLRPAFRGVTHKGLRERGYPHGRAKSQEIAKKKMRNDVSFGKMFMCSASTIGGSRCDISAIDFIAKPQHVRTISEDRRLIADLRFLNMFKTSEDYRKMAVPNVQVLGGESRGAYAKISRAKDCMRQT